MPTKTPILYTVTRPFKGLDGAIHQPGETVDASDWPYARAHQMVDQRYLMPTMAENLPRHSARSSARGGN